MRRRVYVEDARRNGTFVRTTWHPEARQFVISTWDDRVCTGAVRVPVEDVPQLTGLLIDGLAEAAAGPPAVPPTVAVAVAPVGLGQQLRQLARQVLARRRVPPAVGPVRHEQPRSLVERLKDRRPA